MSTADKPLLVLDDVKVTFHTRRGLVRAVDGVSLDVAPGEVLALVGESGCGKTTLIRSILGLEPTRGGIDHVRRQVGRACPARAALPYAAVSRWCSRTRPARSTRATRCTRRSPRGSESTEFGATNRRWWPSALSRAGLRPPEQFVARYPHEISGGQRQRVLIAGAIALEPQLLLADEPVASLDASIRGEILALLRSLVDERGLSIIAVTHDLGLAWNIADRIAVMYLGRIVELGAAEEVLADPQHPYTKALLSVVPEQERLEQQILTGETPDPSRVPSGCRFHPRCPIVASGEAERLGILDRCTGVDLELVERGASHWAACHALDVRAATGRRWLAAAALSARSRRARPIRRPGRCRRARPRSWCRPGRAACSPHPWL